MRHMPFTMPQAGLVLIVPALLYFGYNITRRSMDLYSIHSQAAVIRQEIDALQQRNVDLRRESEFLKTDTFLERAAREQVGLIKPSEIPYIVVTPGESPAIKPAILQPRDDRSNPQRWYDFFFGPR